MRGKKKLIAVAMACLMALLSGCQFTGFDTLNLMKPPKATGDEANIQQVLEEEGGPDISLKYPQSGAYRSAVVMYDITGNGKQEAIAFYASNKGKDTSVHMMVIGSIEDQWTNWGDEPGAGPGVERICFGDLDGDGIKEIIVGWTNSYNNSLNTLSIYRYDNGEIKEVEVDYSYSDIAISDFDKNGEDEIFITTLNNAAEDMAADAKLLKMDRKTHQINNISRVELDPTVVRYEAVKVGNISTNVIGVVIDGYKSDNCMQTEIVYWDNKKGGMVAPLSNTNGDSNDTLRPTATISSDIDGNGIIEIPIVRQMPGDISKEDGTGPCYITQWSWYDVSKGGWEFVYNMVANFSDGYGFQIPDEWEEDKVTARIDTETKTLTFYEWVENSEGVGAQGVAILKIQVFSDSEWQDEKKIEGFTVLRKQNGRVYAVAFPSPDSEFTLNYQQVQKYFKLVSNG